VLSLVSAVEVVRLSIPSRSRHGLMHEVTLTRDPRGLGTSCTCEAATFRPDEACWHVGQALALAGLEAAPRHAVPAPEGEPVRGTRAKPAPAGPRVSAEQAKRARMAARRPAGVPGEQRAPRESAARIRARVDLQALRRVEAFVAAGGEPDPLAGAILERREAIEAEAARHGLVGEAAALRAEADRKAAAAEPLFARYGGGA
jgi:hypothetical protein